MTILSPAATDTNDVLLDDDAPPSTAVVVTASPAYHRPASSLFASSVTFLAFPSKAMRCTSSTLPCHTMTSPAATAATAFWSRVHTYAAAAPAPGEEHEVHGEAAHLHAASLVPAPTAGGEAFFFERRTRRV